MTLVNISLGQSPLSACSSADRDGDANLSISEIVYAVSLSLAF